MDGPAAPARAVRLSLIDQARVRTRLFDHPQFDRLTDPDQTASRFKLLIWDNFFIWPWARSSDEATSPSPGRTIFRPGHRPKRGDFYSHLLSSDLDRKRAGQVLHGNTFNEEPATYLSID